MTHPHPFELTDAVHLTEKQCVLIRPVSAEDQELMIAFFRDLSTEARCNRFLHPVNEVSSELLRQFTHVDHVDHVALVAEMYSDDRETIIGEARFVRTADASLAEVSVSVADAWQRQGLATLMLTKLECHAALAGVRRMFAETLATNKKMLSLARKLGYAISESLGAPGVMRLEKKLTMHDNFPAQRSSVSSRLVRRGSGPVPQHASGISRWSAHARST